jgi:hypothetical protein
MYFPGLPIVRTVLQSHYYSINLSRYPSIIGMSSSVSLEHPKWVGDIAASGLDRWPGCLNIPGCLVA